MKKIKALVVQGFPDVRAALRHMIAAESDIVLLGEYEDGISGFRAIRKHRPHVLFLGVELGAMNGFEILEAADGQAPPAVIFVSKFEAYAVRAFNSQAVDYLLKPFTRARFKEAVDRARARLELSARNGKARGQSHDTPASVPLLGVKVRGRIVLLRPPEIESIVACRTHAVIHTARGTHRARCSLAAFQTKLPASKFIRINRSTMINADHVETAARKSHGDGFLRLTNGQEFPLSRRYRRQWAALIGPAGAPGFQENRSSFHGSAVFE